MSDRVYREERQVAADFLLLRSGAVSARISHRCRWHLTDLAAWIRLAESKGWLTMPALLRAADCVIFVGCDYEEPALARFDEALRYGGLGAVDDRAMASKITA